MTDRLPTTLQFNTTVRFGYGTRSLLPAELRVLGVTRPMVVTDRGELGDKSAGLRTAMRLESGADILTALLEFNKRLGLPAGLRALGFEMAAADSIARAAADDNAHLTNPTLLTPAQYKSILNNAI